MKILKKVIFVIILLVVCIIVAVLSNRNSDDAVYNDSMSAVMERTYEKETELVFDTETEIPVVGDNYVEDENESETDTVVESESEVVSEVTVKSERDYYAELPLEAKIGFNTTYNFDVLKENVSSDMYTEVLNGLKEYLNGNEYEYGGVDQYIEKSGDKLTFYVICGDYRVLEVIVEESDYFIQESDLTKTDLEWKSLDRVEEEGFGEVSEAEKSTLDISNTKTFLPTDCYDQLVKKLEYGYGNCEYMFCIEEESGMIDFFVKTDKNIVEGKYNTYKQTLVLWDTILTEKEVYAKRIEAGD